ncbi:unnamed protein product [Rhizopus stolonifer]
MGMTAADSELSFAKQIPCIGWINQLNTGEQLHPLQALGYFICSQATSLSTLDYEKNAKTVRLLYSFANANLEQLSREEIEKLEAISNICDTSQIQLQKIKRCLEKGNEASNEKGIKLCRRYFGVLAMTKKKILRNCKYNAY